MNIKEKVFLPIKGFFTKEESGTKITLNKLDLADIFIALAPAAIFGSLIFGLRALLCLAISVALAIGLDFLWNIIFKAKKRFSLESVIYGIVAGLTVSSKLNIWLLAAVNVVAFALRKTVFKQRKMLVVTPWLLAKALFAGVFSTAFTTYAFPFIETTNGMLPVDGMLSVAGYTYPAKYLFFGVHSGNIGETSALLLLIGGIYLILRKIINPVIPVSFIITSTVLSLIFGENIGLSLLGGGVIFAAFFLTLDYSFVSSAFYKKLLYGIACGIFTFILRLIFGAEMAYFAVILANCVFLCVNRRNIKRFVRFVKKPDFKRLLNILKTAFSV